MLSTEHILLFAFCLLMLSLLIWMLFPISFSTPPISKKEKPKSQCPLCKHDLYPGEKVRSNQTEIGNIEVQTRIKGCIYCIAPENKLPRRCPICKQDVPKDEMVLATSDPRVDRLKMSIKGCRKCFPQGF